MEVTISVDMSVWTQYSDHTVREEQEMNLNKSDLKIIYRALIRTRQSIEDKGRSLTDEDRVLTERIYEIEGKIIHQVVDLTVEER